MSSWEVVIMDISQEEADRMAKYFDMVDKIYESVLTTLRQSGASDESIAAQELEVLKKANEQAKTILGYSYYPYTRPIGEN